jgi:hypothetical protein
MAPAEEIALPADLAAGHRRVRITCEPTADGPRYVVRRMFHWRTGRRFRTLAQALAFAERWLRGETP